MRSSQLVVLIGLSLTAACSSPVTPVTVLSYEVVVKTAPPATAAVGASVPLVFLVTEHRSDGSLGPAAGKSFTIDVTAGGGSVNSTVTTSITTATDGSASFNWLLGAALGVQSLRGTVSVGNYADVSVTATPGPATRLTVTTQPGPLTTSGAVLEAQPSVQLRDLFDNPVAQAGVAVTASIGAGGGTLGGTVTAVTDGSGRATFATLSISGLPGAVTLTFGASLGGQSTIVSAVAITLRAVWLTKASMAVTRGAVAVAVVNGRVYAVDGAGGGGLIATLEAYDPTSDAWTPKAAAPTARSGVAVGVVNGILYAIGGYDSRGNALATVEAYDPATDSWVTKGPMPTPRAFLSVSVVDNVLYALGGESRTELSMPIVEAYDPVSNSWTSKAELPFPGVGPSSEVINGVLYYFGEIGTYAYDPVAMRWATRAVRPSTRSNYAVGAVGGLAYVVGGEAPQAGTVGRVGTVEVYNPSTNSWSTSNTYITPRSDLGIAVVNGTLFAIGGDTNVGGVATVEALTP